MTNWKVATFPSTFISLIVAIARTFLSRNNAFFEKFVRFLCAKSERAFFIFSKKLEKAPKTMCFQCFFWYARHDSNVRPTESESVTLSS